jgi:hypothetical protein
VELFPGAWKAKGEAASGDGGPRNMPQRQKGGLRPASSRTGYWRLWLESAEWHCHVNHYTSSGPAWASDTNQLRLGSGRTAASSRLTGPWGPWVEVSRILRGFFFLVCPYLHPHYPALVCHSSFYRPTEEDGPVHGLLPLCISRP